MKRLLNDWWFGFHFLVRGGIALLLMSAGFHFLNELPLASAAMSIPMPFYLLISLEVLYVVVLCPFFLASYARYCGHTSRAGENSAS